MESEFVREMRSEREPDEKRKRESGIVWMYFSVDVSEIEENKREDIFKYFCSTSA